MSVQILISYFFQFLHIFVKQPVGGLLELLMAFSAQVDYCLLFFVIKIYNSSSVAWWSSQVSLAFFL